MPGVTLKTPSISRSSPFCAFDLQNRAAIDAAGQHEMPTPVVRGAPVLRGPPRSVEGPCRVTGPGPVVAETCGALEGGNCLWGPARPLPGRLPTQNPHTVRRLHRPFGARFVTGDPPGGPGVLRAAPVWTFRDPRRVRGSPEGSGVPWFGRASWDVSCPSLAHPWPEKQISAMYWGLLWGGRKSHGGRVFILMPMRPARDNSPVQYRNVTRARGVARGWGVWMRRWMTWPAMPRLDHIG
ncbi:hypothetical protein J2Y41_003922 [Arthrobacter sp. 1088]|nr:hypothetical protein [Arthrobacter sp. 1088]